MAVLTWAGPAGAPSPNPAVYLDPGPNPKLNKPGDDRSGETPNSGPQSFSTESIRRLGRSLLRGGSSVGLIRCLRLPRSLHNIRCTCSYVSSSEGAKCSHALRLDEHTLVVEMMILDALRVGGEQMVGTQYLAQP